jgi:hypothetical protein
MSWFADQRQNWITQTLKVYGFINRQHLMRNFGISNAQAALNFKSFNIENPGEMAYDNIQKCYVATTKPH